MIRTFARNALSTLAVLTLGFPVTATADNVIDFINITDDEADDFTFLELQNNGFTDVGLCHDEGDLQFYVDNNCAALSEMVLTQSGDLGVGTTAPQGFVHLVTDLTQDLILESSAGGDQFWLNNDGSDHLEFDSTTTNNILVLDSSNGGVGVGTGAPSVPLHVQRSDGTSKILVEEGSSTTATRDLLALKNNGIVLFGLENTDTGQIWDFSNRTTGFNVTLRGSGGPEMVAEADGTFRVGPGSTTNFTVHPNGDATLNGTLTEDSSRETKTAIEPVDPDSVLAKLESLPLSEWQYEDNDSRHIGPMAEDFHGAFGFGPDSEHIAPKDMAGVAMASTQALSDRTRQQAETIEAQAETIETQAETVESQGAMINTLQERIEALESRNESLAVRVDQIEDLRERLADIEAQSSERIALGE